MGSKRSGAALIDISRARRPPRISVGIDRSGRLGKRQIDPIARSSL